MKQKMKQVVQMAIRKTNNQTDETTVTYIVGLGDKSLEKIRLTREQTTYPFMGHLVESHSGTLILDGELWDGCLKNDLFAIRQNAKVIWTNRPRRDFILTNLGQAGIQIGSGALIKFYYRGGDYFLDIFSNGNPVYLNEVAVDILQTKFQVSDRLFVGGIEIELREQQLKVTHFYQEAIQLDPELFIEEAQKMEYPKGFPHFRRSPRIFLREPDREVQVKSPKPEEGSPRGNLLRAIVPPLGMIIVTGAVSIFTKGNPLMMLGMGSMSLLTAGFTVSGYFTDKQEIKEKNRQRSEQYQDYLIEKESELVALHQAQLEAMNYNFPNVELLAMLAKTYSSRIYEKMPANEDFLNVHLGHGTIDSSYRISYSLTDRQDNWDRLADEKLVHPHKKIEKAPIIVSLRDQTLGLAGPSATLRVAVQTILFQIAMLHSYHDVEFVTLVPESDYEDYWKEWRWLPHNQMSSLNLRGIIHNNQTRDMVLTSFYQLLVKRRQQLRELSNSESHTFSPHYIFTILDESWIMGHGLNEFLAEDMTQYGVTVIWAKDSINMLPETATSVVDYQSGESARLINDHLEYVNQTFTPNHLPQGFTIEEAIYRLANLNHLEVEKNSIPEMITFLELYQTKDVKDLAIRERWRRADPSKTLAVPLGVRGKNDVVYLNLHERAHGPHGLIAGTTGSGKSEIVQSYILSLAVNFSPEDVGFLPIDFKGGGMADLFTKLPHLLGAITNLDGAASARALKSIRAELEKRQREFKRYGVNHINGYTKLYRKGKEYTDPQEKEKYPKKPMPHLFLISDEFAELKANEPDFMAELVSTARIGRSLGVHLILATQKPSGVVDDQIWSNSRFKLALKVADTSDSNEIIKTPDAASITQPGRAYLQVGNNEIYELFQSAWSGANYNPKEDNLDLIDERIWTINQLGQAELLMDDSSDYYAQDELLQEEKKTELEVVIQEIVSEFAKTTQRLPDKPWLPPLERELVTPMIVAEVEWQKPRALSIPFGILDRPSKQSQEAYFFDIEEVGNTVIYGSPGYGKSTALQTIIMNLSRQNSPEQLQFNLFDFGTNGLLPLKDLPHVFDIVRLDEMEKLQKFLTHVQNEMKRRKQEFTEVGVSSLSQYQAKTGRYLPVLINVFDVYDSVRESPLEEQVDAVINQLLQEGASLGIYTILTALTFNSLKMRMNANMSNKISLYLVEDDAMRMIMGRDALIPQEIFGRAQIEDEEILELQIYLPIEGHDDIDRLARMTEEISALNASWDGEPHRGIPMLPTVLKMDNFRKASQVKRAWERGELPIGMDKETTDVQGFVPERDGYFVLFYDTGQQIEYLEHILFAGFEQLEGKVNRIMIDLSENGRGTEYFDTVLSPTEVNGFFADMTSEIQARQLSGARHPIYVYISEAQMLNRHLVLTQDSFQNLLRQSSKVGIHFIFLGEQKQIANGYLDVDKVLKNNPPSGTIGTRFQDQGIIQVRSHFSEPPVATDETNFYIGRTGYRVKLVSE